MDTDHSEILNDQLKNILRRSAERYQSSSLVEFQTSDLQSFINDSNITVLYLINDETESMYMPLLKVSLKNNTNMLLYSVSHINNY